MIEFIVRPLSDADAFLTAYRALFPRCEGAGIFQSPPWMELWIESVPAEINLWTVEARRDGETVLLGVFGARARRPFAALAPKCVRLFEFDLPQYDAVYTEYNDFLVAADAPSEIREHALLAAAEQLGPLDELVIRNARETLVSAGRRLAQAQGRKIRILRTQPTFTVNLSSVRAAGGDYLATRSAAFRRQIRRSAALYEARGALSLRLAAGAAERERAWSALTRLHKRARTARGAGGAFGNEAFSSFHRKFCERFPENAHLMELRAGDDVIAVLYNLMFEGRAYSYQSGFAPEADNRLKPGLLAHCMAIDFYAERGAQTYDLLAGDAPYKRRLADKSETLTSFSIDLANGAVSRARSFIRSARTALQSLGMRRT